MLSDQGSTEHDSAWWYKVANGSETQVTFTQSASSAYDYAVIAVTGWTGTPTLEDSDEDENYLINQPSTSAGVSSFGAGSVTNLTASAIVLAFFTSDSRFTIDSSRSVSDGSAYTEGASASADGQNYIYYRTVSSTGTYSPVYSFSDTGDQAYGAVAVFGDVAAGSNYTLTGAVTHTLTPAATFSINRQYSIAGAVSFTLTPSATLAINRAYTLTGAVTHTLTPSASMAYTAAGTAAITGDVTYTLTPAATFAINRAYTLTGSVSHTLSVAATMQYTAQQAIEFVGTVTYTLTPQAVMVGPGADASAPPALAGGVGHGRKRRKRRVMVDGYVYLVDEAEERALLARLAQEKAQEAQLLEALGDPQTAAEVRRKAFRIARRADMADPYERIRNDDEEILGRFIGLLAA